MHRYIHVHIWIHASTGSRRGQGVEAGVLGHSIESDVQVCQDRMCERDRCMCERDRSRDVDIHRYREVGVSRPSVPLCGAEYGWMLL